VKKRKNPHAGEQREGFGCDLAAFMSEKKKKKTTKPRICEQLEEGWLVRRGECGSSGRPPAIPSSWWLITVEKYLKHN
jgi:hypothetical protein